MTSGRRIRRPFRNSARKPSRAELRALISGLYGPEAPSFPGSPYEGTPDNTVETVLHEWGHIVQLAGVALSPRKGEIGSVLAFEHLAALPSYLAERNEIRTVAITVGVARALRLPIVLGPLVWSALKNSRLLGAGEPGVAKRGLREQGREDLLAKLTTRAGRTPAVRRSVQQILDFSGSRVAEVQGLVVDCRRHAAPIRVTRGKDVRRTGLPGCQSLAPQGGLPAMRLDRERHGTDVPSGPLLSLGEAASDAGAVLPEQ